MKDLHDNIKVTAVLAPATIDSDTTTAGAIIDTQGFESLEFVVQAGAIADGAFAGALAESDAANMAGETVVAAASLLGTVPSFADTEGGLVKKVGYRGTKRYVRLDLVSTDTDDGGLFGAIAVQSNPRNSPVA